MTQSKPSITQTTHPLPFERLSALEFERLCLWLVEREGYTRAEHLGLAGSEQGRDVVAYKVTPQGEELWYFQCKRYRSIGAGTLKKEVDKYLELIEEKPHLKPFGVVFVVSCAVSADAREVVGGYCERHNLAHEFWALTELDMRAKRHADLRREFFGAQIPTTEIPFQAPQLPDQYVERTAELKHLKESLLPAESGASLPVSRAVLHGIAAVGKSVLAVAFAHDEAVRKAFPGGVLWVILGTDPNLPQRLADWGRALNDPSVIKGAYADEQAGTSQLRTRLQDKACLLVVDDAWDDDHVKPFLVGGPNCLLLVTSRKRDIVSGATGIFLDVMREAEAMQLMANWAGEIAKADQLIVAELVDELGHLPLALELTGAQVKKLKSWQKVRQRWREHKLAAIKRGRRVETKEDSLLLSIGLSLDALHEDDREPYLQLGIFPEDTPFPAGAAAALWGWGETDAEEFLIDLVGQALLTPREIEGEQRYTSQTVLYDFVAERLGEEGRRQAHRALVGGYRERCGGVWAELAPDGYIHDHLARHMAGGGPPDELYALIEKPWMDVQFERTYSHRAFAGDVAVAIEAAGTAAPPNFVQLVRNCLIYATLGSAASNVLPETLGVLAQVGQVAKARGYAALMRSEARIRAYQLIGEALLEQGRKEKAMEVLGQALTVAEATKDEWERAAALSDVAQALAQTGQFDRALAVAKGIGDEYWKARALRAVAQALAQAGEQSRAAEVANRVLAVAEGIGDEWEKARALSGVAQALAQAGEMDGLNRALAAAKEIEDEERKPRALSGVAQALAQTGQFDPALALAEGIGDEWEKARALSGVAQALAEAGEFDRAKAVAVGIDDEGWRVFALGEAAQALARAGEREWAAEVAYQALAEAGAIEDEGEKASALSGVAEVLAQAGRADQALGVVEAIEDRAGRSQALSRVAQALAQAGEFNQALALAKRIEAERWKAAALSDVAQALAQAREKARAAEVANQALAVAEGIEIGGERAKASALSGVAQALAQVGQLDQALAVAEAIRYEREKASAVSGVAQALAEAGQRDRAAEVADRALAETKAIKDEGEKAPALSEVSHALAQAGELDRAKAVTEDIDDEVWRAVALRGVAQALAQVGEFDRALAEAGSITDEGEKASTLSRVAQAVSRAGEKEWAAEIANQALTLVEAIWDEGERACALSRVAQVLSRAGKKDRAAEVANWALAEVGEMDGGWEEAFALSGLAQVLAQGGEMAEAEEVANRALAVAEGIGVGFFEADALSRVAQALAQMGQQERALQALRTAFTTARLAGRGSVFGALEQGSATLAAVDGGQALWQVYEAVMEAEGWWGG